MTNNSLFYEGNITETLAEIASEFIDPRILLLDLERWIDEQFLALVFFGIKRRRFEKNN